MLEGHAFLTSSVNPTVKIAFSEEASSTQSSDSELTDTDLESINEEAKQVADLKPMWCSFNNPSLDTLGARGPKWSYLKKDEIPGGDAQESFNKNLCSKLAKDAFRIANAHKHARTMDSTTCLCVVSRDKDEYAKKLVFHNFSDDMHASMKSVAYKLGYGTRTGYQAYAEVELIECLLHRNNQSDIHIFWVWDVADNIAKNVNAYCNYFWDPITTNLLLSRKKKNRPNLE